MGGEAARTRRRVSVFAAHGDVTRRGRTARDMKTHCRVLIRGETSTPTALGSDRRGDVVSTFRAGLLKLTKKNYRKIEFILFDDTVSHHFSS